MRKGGTPLMAQSGGGTKRGWNRCHGSAKCLETDPQEIQHYFLENYHELIQPLLDHMETTQRIRREEHAEMVATLDRMHYFECQARERVVVVWHGQNLLYEKVDKEQSQMAHFDGHVQYALGTPPPLGRISDNPTSITSYE